ncbi:transglutaminase-like domain-containing protein [Aquimarina spongiae]|uniref:Transglutaminase-like superfamily protein n=1 Tax=Aquimarina spongiae TaxID=570521 RepID=A0A1M6AD41_9FLAO|nr:transglutaminase family protein [Aquimarina spongiae]SHI34349.1 Transglutaminase-like superfamily protein [Aquimarina spongiae]
MEYLEHTYYLDYKSKEIQELIEEFDTQDLSSKEKAIGWYYKVRDQWKYDPYSIHLSKEKYRASEVAKQDYGHCVDKSILLIAGLRALGIPARIHLAKVKNHIAVERLTEKFGTNELAPHGMVDLFLEGKWLKVSPAFNKALCEKCNVAPLDFDGEQDSMFHEYDRVGNVFMEYVEDYGHFEDVPFEFMIATLETNYPDIMKISEGLEMLKV